MGLFEKKYCCICGEKIGLLGNRKLEDGNLCKNCAKLLSPFFTERRKSTVTEIQEQLAYREANKAEVAKFHCTQTYGSRTRLLLDEQQRKFMVTGAKDIEEANPDVISIADITDCRIDLTEREVELKGETPDGKSVSYAPKQYALEYDFYVVITVNHPYFDGIRFQLNSSSVEVKPTFSAAQPMFHPDRVQEEEKQAPPIPVSNCIPADPNQDVEYQKYTAMGEEIQAALSGLRQAVRDTEAAAAKPKAPVRCTSCGAVGVPDANGCCEYCGCALL